MICLLLIAIPFLSGVISFFIRNDFSRRGLIVIGSGAHLALVCALWQNRQTAFLGQWFAFDSIGIIFLTVTSILFFGASLYCVRYLTDESSHQKAENSAPKRFSNEAVFSGCFLLFLSTMTVVIASQHLAVLWVGIEATTLTSAPLIYFHRTKRSLEATWKYLLICSVGIAIALLGIFFLAVARNSQQQMFLPDVIENAQYISIPWLKAAFLLMFVGYGTKMGLAPFHTWLPDAHSEAPSVVSALLSGALLNCAFLGILRVYQVCIASGLQLFCQEIFIIFGILSVLVAAIFILRQTDYKRMLAYSSVEHMGIIVLGFGLSGVAVFGAMVNMLGHSLTKAGLFFVAGNILTYFKTKKISDIKGLIFGKTRLFGALWITGFLLITGTPPSGIFLGKFIILKQALFGRHYRVALIFLSALAVIFIGMARIFISMTQGNALLDVYTELEPHKKRYILRNIIPGIFFITAISIGLYFPDWLKNSIDLAVKALVGGY